MLLPPVPALVCVPPPASPSSLPHGRPPMLLLPVRHEAVRERPLLPLRPPPLSGEYIISNGALLFLNIYRAFLRLTLIRLSTHFFLFILWFLFFCSLSIRRMHLPLVLYYLMSPSLRYIPFLPTFFFFFFLHLLLLPHAIGCLIFLSASSPAIGSFVPHFFFSFLSSRMSPSLSLYITPRLRRFLPP